MELSRSACNDRDMHRLLDRVTARLDRRDEFARQSEIDKACSSSVLPEHQSWLMRPRPDSAPTLEPAPMVSIASKRPKRDTVSTAAWLQSDITGRVTYTADYVSQLPQEILELASQLLKDCWPTNGHVKRIVTTLLEGQRSVELHSAFVAASGAKFRSGGKASSEELQLRLALMWVGGVVTACCLYTNSHEEQRDGPQYVRASREQDRERRTEIVLFGVRQGDRRRRVGSALLAYVTYLAAVRHLHPL